jgi:hypothetical protein
MAVISMKMALPLGIFFLCVSINADTKAVLKRSSKMSSVQIFSPKIVLHRIPLKDNVFELPYKKSDMGVDFDKIPKPFIFSPGAGSFFINPGNSSSSQTSFECISEDGKILFKNDILSFLKIPSDVEPYFLKLCKGAHGKILLVYAFTLNEEINCYQNCSVAVLSEKGNVETTFALPDIKPEQPVFPLISGHSWLINGSHLGMTWDLMDSHKTVLHSIISSTSDAFVLPDGSLVVLGGHNEIKYCKIDGTVAVVPCSGEPIRIDAIIPGNGSFFGILAFSEKGYQKNKTGGTEQHLSIQVGWVDPVNFSLYFFPVTQISPNVFGKEDEFFIYYETDMMSFDEKGNLFTVARTGPDNPAFVIEKWSLSEDALKMVPKKEK